MLEQVRGEEKELIKRTERSIVVASQTMDKLRDFIVSTSFSNTAEEIEFFKFWKPRCYSHLIYFLKVLSIESRKPFGDKQEIESYYRKQQAKLNYFIENNLAFYQYYRMNANHLDEQYFLRRHYNISPDVDEVYFNSDPRFTSLMDYKMAKLLANKMLTTYIDHCLTDLISTANNTDNAQAQILPTLTWTAPKASLIELVYALQSDGVFNNSNADISQIATMFEQMFNVDLGNYYRVFQDIRIRKKSRTSFLDHLKETLGKRMDETDEHPRQLK